MNAEIMQERWNQLRSEAQQRWNRLTDEDLEGARNQATRLVDAVSDRYGYSRDLAQEEVDRFMRQYGDDIKATADTWMSQARRVVEENPWAVFAGGILLLGLVSGLVLQLKRRSG